MDFFTVPTLTFGVLYCFFVIGHDRHKILRFNLIRNPSCPMDRAADARSLAIRISATVPVVRTATRNSVHDVLSAVREMGSEPVGTAYRSPCEHINCQFNDMRYGQANQKQNTGGPVRQCEQTPGGKEVDQTCRLTQYPRCQ